MNALIIKSNLYSDNFVNIELRSTKFNTKCFNNPQTQIKSKNRGVLNRDILANLNEVPLTLGNAHMEKK